MTLGGVLRRGRPFAAPVTGDKFLGDLVDGIAGVALFRRAARIAVAAFERLAAATGGSCFLQPLVTHGKAGASKILASKSVLDEQPYKHPCNGD